MEIKYFIVEKIHINNNVSDMMIQPLSREKFKSYKRQTSLMNLPR
jgi:hypothetical protein